MMARWWFAVLIVSFAVVRPYVFTVNNYFQGDDFGFVRLFANKPAWHFLSLFTHSWAPDVFGPPLDEFRPFPAISYQIGNLFSPYAPTAHHVIGLVIHAVNALLVSAV